MTDQNGSLQSITETMSVGRQVSVGGPTGSKVRFGMLPADILARTDLTAAAKIVFAVLRMESFGSGGVAISHGATAKESGISRSQVHAIFKQLESAGLINRVGAPSAQVQAYQIPCDCLGDELPLMPAEPKTMRKARVRPKLELCEGCGKPCVRSTANGWCRKCERESSIRRIAKQEIRRAQQAGSV